jgi:CheY-like chemotaxis protein
MAQLRALICEDDPSIRALVRTVLVREGFAVDVAPDGAVGLERLRLGCYDVLLLDLMMPGVDGLEVIRTVKEERPPTLKRVVVMTAPRRRSRTRCRNRSADFCRSRSTSISSSPPCAIASTPAPAAMWRADRPSPRRRPPRPANRRR